MATLQVDPITAEVAREKTGSEDIDLERFLLDAVKKKTDINVVDLITSADVVQTIESASTLTVTVHDPHWNLLDSGIFDRAIDVKVDGYHYRLVSVGPQDDDLELVFEDRDVVFLRNKNKPHSARRNVVTRAEFMLWLVRQVKQKKIEVVIKELHKQQPQTKPKGDVDRERRREQGLAGTDYYVWYPGTIAPPTRPQTGTPVGKPTLGGSAPKRATKEQIRNMERVLDVGVDMRAPEKILIAAIITIMVESSCRNPKGGDADSRGIFQQQKYINGRRTQWPATGNIEKDARGFYKAAKDLFESDNSLKPWEISVQVQRPHSSTYWKNKAATPFALRVIEQYAGDVVTEIAYRGQYRFSTLQDGKKQNYWEAIGRLCDEVGWSRWMSNGVLYIMSQEDLFKSKPSMTLTRETRGVHRINFRWDVGKKVAEMTVICRAERWTAPPGTLIKVEEAGPASGKWLVGEVRRSLFSKDCTIILKKPEPELKEPAPEIKTVSVDESSNEEFGRLGLHNSEVIKAYRRAKRIDGEHFPYVWGGGHAHAAHADRGTGGQAIGYDCSGAIGALLAVGGRDWAGLADGDSVPGSGSFGGLMVPGEGRELTVWYNPTHVFCEFKRKGKYEHFGTGDWGKGWRGAGFNPNRHPKAGFKAAHPAGA